MGGVLGGRGRDGASTQWAKTKKGLYRIALQHVEGRKEQRHTGEEGRLPFPSFESFRLLGLRLDRTWSFQEHATEMQQKTEYAWQY